MYRRGKRLKNGTKTVKAYWCMREGEKKEGTKKET